jgi:hypothetical protein
MWRFYCCVSFGGWGGWLSDIEVAFKYGGASACEVMSQELCSHRLLHKILDIYFSLHGIAPCDLF